VQRPRFARQASKRFRSGIHLGTSADNRSLS
jgi:hypothetical protein